MARRMADPEFRREQLEHRDDEHVEDLNALVDDLRALHAPAFVPLVPPHQGGFATRVLALHRTPPAGLDPALGGSGFTSLEGDDDGAERHLQLVEEAGVDPDLVLPWFAVPYVVADDQELTNTDVKAGRAALERLVPLLPRLRSVVLHGRDVEPVWKAFAGANASALHGVRVEPWTFSTRTEALAQHRASRVRKLTATYASVAEALR